ncbi:hypothetical protein KU392_05480 [Advenella alkanexedens]|jgi:hypothetical protein|uniref:Transmembrane protein n=1 Tax=Advenella alkanexedens TaxID=1481665 RepID=A0ABS6NM57_9BURK|nr:MULTISPECIES: hypothetical protein [Advenella]MBV4396711.1 hypothetical protein [Advenella alkanexedens]MDD3758368.1 hypothetical protein [Advenella sp.]NLN67468.1 DUF4175 domain-containing protein [Alcaligenaceae bacterium]WKU19678.1 hypothetical protein Q3V95_01150 [Advenella alkanexedens]
MTELLLGLNILYEWFLLSPVLPTVMAVLLIAAYVWAMARKPLNWKGSWPLSWKVGLLVAVAAFFGVPWWVDSSVTELNYLPDWLLNISMAIGIGVYGALLVWPLFGIIRKARA